MKRVAIFLALALAACQQLPPQPNRYRAPAPDPVIEAVQTAPPAEFVFRYHRHDRIGDTLRVTAPTPDQLLVLRYTYVCDTLRWIDVYDYDAETDENRFDFDPKFYQILVDGRYTPADTL